MRVKNYFKDDFSSDLKAGFITAIVALPLAIAFAIASGVNPMMGIYTAIIAGILASIFGGSTFSITGPTGAMAIIILTTVGKFGLEGLLVAGFLAGVIQIILGVIRLGRLVKFIPLPIVSGFTAGIGAIIFIGQIPNFLGLIIPAKEHVGETILEVIKNIGAVNLAAVLIAIGTLLILIFMPRILAKISLKAVPASMIALILATFAAYSFSLSIPQVGHISSSLPAFNFFNINLQLVENVLPAAFTIALLGAIEALLCAVVCDGMTGTKHKSNKELIAQGTTNIVLPFFGGMPSTAAIARSAVNIREGARTRMAGVYHALIILLIILFFAPIAQYIPKAFLAGVLMFVAIRMINFKEFKTIFKISKEEGVVLILTFSLTLFTDLVFAVQVGMMLAVFLLFLRLSKLVEFDEYTKFAPNKELSKRLNADHSLKDVGIYTMAGPFFFGAMNVFDSKVEEHIDVKKKYLIIRMKHVPLIDSSGIERMKSFIESRNKGGNKVFLTTLQPKVKEVIFDDEEFKKLIADNNIFDTSEEALDFIKAKYLTNVELNIKN
ncbi:MAG: SulP family inorganic anion transporter [Candidatus Woesearchaeota archaeon]|jgi:SulP family sulfate permease